MAFSGRSQAILITVVLSVGLIVAAFVSNPTPQQHRAAIQRAMADRSPLSALLGLGALAALTSTYHPLGVASYTTVNGRVVAIGAFGQVMVCSPTFNP